jgi:hypothetical protein
MFQSGERSDDLATLRAKSHRLKVEAARLLREANGLDAYIEAARKAADDSA